MTPDDLVALRRVSASMGIMLETPAARLSARGGPHWASPDKDRGAASRRSRRGRAADPVHERDPIGIGETREERLDASSRSATSISGTATCRRRSSRTSARSPRRVWPRTLADARRPPRNHRCGRIALGPRAHAQAPPKFAFDDFPRLLDAGIDDWGGVSPVTIDHVNPEAPWPEVERLREATGSRGLELAPRLPSTRSTSARTGSTRACSAPRLRAPTRSASAARTAGRPATWARCRSSSGATHSP